MRKGFKTILAGIFFLLTLTFSSVMNDDKVHAEVIPDAWYEDYRYEWVSYDIDGKYENYLLLLDYIGNDTTIYVPATAVCNGQTYRTKIGSSVWKNEKKVTSIEFEEGIVLGNDIFDLFCGMKNLKTINAEVLDMSTVEIMDSMFFGCESLTKLNIRNWDVSNVENMMFVFYKCDKLTSLDLSGWNTSNVTNMNQLFGCCSSLRSVNLKGWDTSNVRKMDGMFVCDYSLESVDLSSFDMSKVKFSKGNDPMFLRCNSLKTIKTPKKVKEKIPVNNYVTYGKKNGKKVGKEGYTYIPKGNKSITLVALQSKSKSTKINKISSSKGKIKFSWKKVHADGRSVQYELQCSTNKKFTDKAGKMVKPLRAGLTYCAQENITEKTSATWKGLTPGNTYYVRIRVFTEDSLLSNWSEVKKIAIN